MPAERRTHVPLPDRPPRARGHARGLRLGLRGPGLHGRVILLVRR
ncbi:protein of unassigned function [Methylobacterium oryzae CBMB20]|uniref:Protein of unassigned function n=1 Tax=Methylobacterium oryzae CBMB20 TaxID=693986 RepID=A0A089NZY0_9HYPH|nr:protein of unassigned function [Methylobacterium oryzae CBMB20]